MRPRPKEGTAISVRGLKNAFGAEVIHQALELDVRRGEILGVVGGSGTGKSVLLRTIIGLNKPVAGQVEVLGEDVAKLSAKALRALERRWGVLFQNGALFTSLTVLENAEVPLKEHLHLQNPLLEEIAAMKLGLVGLDADALNKLPSQLSGGMNKRAALARALVLDPELVFLDEPTSGLDPVNAEAFDGLIRSLKEVLGLTVFLVTHDLDTLVSVCDRVAVLAEKRVIAIGTLDEVVKNDHPWVQEYFNGPRGRSARHLPAG